MSTVAASRPLSGGGSASSGSAGQRGSFSQYVAVLAQATLLLFLAERFKLENDLFLLVFRVCVAGFAIHHLLPQRLRLSFFTSLSMGTILYCLGLDQGGWSLSQTMIRGFWLLGFSAILIGICHLPFRYAIRVALLLLAAAGLAIIRGGWLKLTVFESVWPVFAAMFMIRIMIYLYDLDTLRTKPTILRTLSYFFTFPNLWLYVSPVLDYKSFHASYYNSDAFGIYQRGIVWITRGIFHLLLWKIVYYQVYVDPARVTNGVELAQFLFGNIALYLRLSGQFHIMTGMLHLFGFHLSETHRLYFLASSFTDYWRRVNIYWKDFMVKIFFYPLFVRIKRLGVKGSVITATSVVFFLTWALHPVQFFWIRGSFPMKDNDMLFWALLCVLVCIGAVRELNTVGRDRKTVAVQNVSWSGSLRKAGYAAVVFLGITILWSIWSSDNLAQWVDLWRNASIETLGLSLLAMGAVFLSSLWFEGPIATSIDAAFTTYVSQGWGVPWRRAFASCFLPAVLMVASTSSHVTSRILPPEGQAIAESVFQTRPNKSDEEFMVRGYYEDLADTTRFQTLLNDGFRNQPADWVKLEDTPAVRPVRDLRVEELVPSLETVVNGKRIITNRWGMRSPEIDPENPGRAVRIAVLGASHEMGYGVDHGESFSDLLSAKLNSGREPGSRPVEVLNFAMNHYSPVAQVEVVKRKVLQFKPDSVLFFAHREDVGVVMRLFGAALRQGVQPEYPYLANLAREAGIGERTPRSIAERKLIPHWAGMIEWAYREVAQDLLEHGITPVWVLQEGVYPHQGADEAFRMRAMAKSAGFEIWALDGVFHGHDPADLIVAPWDTHPNAAGHRLIAEKLHGLVQSTGLIARLAARSDPKQKQSWTR